MAYYTVPIKGSERCHVPGPEINWNGGPLWHLMNM